jgi:serine protease Do
MNLEDLSNEIVKLVVKVNSSVVTILTRQISYDEFLQPSISEGIGSGFSVAKGLFITSFHVIRQSKDIKLISREGKVSKGEVVAVNPNNDLALIRSELELQSLKLAKEMNLGELVFAIGSPLGLDSVTIGIISGLGRAIISPSGNPLFVIQADVAVNPGNSGGPLINVKGEVVGVVTAMIPFTQGIGFAVPSTLVKGFVTNVMKFGKYLRPFLGVLVTKINKSISSYYGLPKDEGLLVVRIYPGSPAYYSGIRAGDIILEVDGKKVKDAVELQVILEEKGPGEKVNVLVNKGSKDVKIPIEIGAVDVTPF